jgi:hypothetical protein
VVLTGFGLLKYFVFSPQQCFCFLPDPHWQGALRGFFLLIRGAPWWRGSMMVTLRVIWIYD